MAQQEQQGAAPKPQPKDAVKSATDTARNVLAGAEKKFPGSMASAAGVTPAGQRGQKPAAPMTPKPTGDGLSNGGSGIGKELAAKSAEVQQYSDSLPKMHTGGDVTEDGDYKLQRGEKVIPAVGRHSEYRDVFLARGKAGLHKYNAATPAKDVTRQDGGNTHPMGESHDSGAEKVPNPTKE